MQISTNHATKYRHHVKVTLIWQHNIRYCRALEEMFWRPKAPSKAGQIHEKMSDHKPMMLVLELQKMLHTSHATLTARLFFTLKRVTEAIEVGSLRQPTTKQVTSLPSPRSGAQVLICFPVRGAPWWVLLQHSYYVAIIFIVECGIAHVLCMHLPKQKFGNHPYPLGYLCDKFRYFRSLRYSASPRRKIAYSIIHSLTDPAYMMPQEPLAFWN